MGYIDENNQSTCERCGHVGDYDKDAFESPNDYFADGDRKWAPTVLWCGYCIGTKKRGKKSDE